MTITQEISLLTGALEPITLDQAKDHMRVEATEDNALVTASVMAARQHIERYLDRTLVGKTISFKFSRFFENRIEVPRPPFRRTISLTYLDSSNQKQTLVNGTDFVDNTTEPFANSTFNASGFIQPAFNKIWPLTLDTESSVELLFEAGYQTPKDVPADIKHAMLLLVGQYYSFRESLHEGTNVVVLPLGIERILSPFRSYQFVAL